MQMTGYTKLFGSIVASTIWREPHTVRIVWITMLAMANKNGIVEASLPGLADLARVSIDECKAAIVALESPDEHSRTPDNEGRRVQKCDGGWFVLNHSKYRAKMGADEKREYFRLKKQEQRAKSNLSPTLSKTVKDSRKKSPMSRHAEAQSETETETKELSPSERGAKFSDWFKTLLPSTVRLSDGWREKWAKCFDDMIRLDARTPEQIQAVCKWARSDSFWASNFLSPCKLRERKDGVQYFDVFSVKMNPAELPLVPRPAKVYHAPRENM